MTARWVSRGRATNSAANQPASRYFAFGRSITSSVEVAET